MLFDLKNRAKARVKGAMRVIRNNDDALRRESLAKKLLSKSGKAFWKEIKLINTSNLSLPNVIDGVTGPENIVNMWKTHLEDLLHCLKNEKDLNLCKDVAYEVGIEVSHADIVDAIRDLTIRHPLYVGPIGYCYARNKSLKEINFVLISHPRLIKISMVLPSEINFQSNLLYRDILIMLYYVRMSNCPTFPGVQCLNCNCLVS